MGLNVKEHYGELAIKPRGDRPASAVVRRAIDEMIQSAVEPLRKQQLKLSTRVESVAAEIKECTSSISSLASRKLHPFVKNEAGPNMTHVTVCDYTLLQPLLWSTRCGWYYGKGARFIRLASVAGMHRDRICRACMPDDVAREQDVLFEDVNVGAQVTA